MKDNTTPRTSLSRRNFLRLGAGTAGIALLAACGAPAAPSQAPAAESGASTGPQEVTLTAWNLTPLQTDWLNASVPLYNESQTNYVITVDATNFPGAELAEKIMGTFVAGSGSPDLPFIQEWDFTKYIRGGYTDTHLTDLSPYLTAEDLENLSYEEAWRWKDGHYGLNIDMSLSIYYYRQDIFEEIGEDPTAWETYDDFIAAGLKLKEQKNAFMTAQDIAGWNQYLILAHQNGGGWFSPDGENVLNSQENIEALQLWLDLAQTHEISWTTSQFYGPGTTDAQRAGEIAGMLIPDWYHNQYFINQLPEQAGLWRIRPLPRFREGGARTAHRGGTAMTMYKETANPDAAWDFMRFLFLDVDGVVTRFTSALGQFPSYAPAWEDERLLEYAPEFFGGQEINRVLAELGPECPPYYAHPFKIDALNTINSDVLPAILDGSKTPEQALNDAKETVDGIIANSGFEI
jgi:ABC-type glycerol-3-phosphate transport system substrate-binding protein